MIKPELTDMQRNVYNFMVRGLIADQRIPTIQDIKARFNFASGNAASAHLKALVKKGYLVSRKKGGRSPYKIAGAIINVSINGKSL